MNLPSVVHILLYSVPVIVAFSSFLFVLSTYQDKETHIAGRLRGVTLSYYAASTLVSIGLFLYPYSAEVFAQLSALNYGAMIAVPVLLYHIIFILTRQTESEHFSKFHYLFPLLVFCVLMGWSIFIPYDVKIEVASSRAGVVSGYEAFAAVSRSRMEVRMIFGLIYLGLILIRTHQYRINAKEQDDYKEVIQWAVVLGVLAVVTLGVPIIGLFKQSDMYHTFFPAIVIVLMAVFQLEFLFRLIGKHFPQKIQQLLINKQVSKESLPAAELHKSKKLDKDTFQVWIKQTKPYLNPEYTIDNAVEDLDINRTYISKFVNDTYKMNFSRYLNTLRLKELKRLLRLQSNKDKTAADLVLKAGFGSYRNYLRTKNEGNKKSTSDKIPHKAGIETDKTKQTEP